MALKTLKLNKEEQTNAQRERVSKFTEKAKDLALLECMGSESKRIPKSESLTNLPNSDNAAFRKVLEILGRHYGHYGEFGKS